MDGMLAEKLLRRHLQPGLPPAVTVSTLLVDIIQHGIKFWGSIFCAQEALSYTLIWM